MSDMNNQLLAALKMLVKAMSSGKSQFEAIEVANAAIAAAEQAQPVGQPAWQLFKQALFVGMERNCVHYLMANAHGRRDGALKAHNHEHLCRHIIAAVRGCDPDWVRHHYEDDYQAVHDGTQALTSYLDEAIGFPLDERPDYDDLTPKFFDRFFDLAMQALHIEPQPASAQPVAVPDIDWLAQVIRIADGKHSLGAGALAEKIVDAMLAYAPKP